MIQNIQAKNRTEKVVDKNPIVHCKLITNVSFFAPVTNQNTLLSSSCTFAKSHLTGYNHWLWIRVRLILLAWHVHLHENETKGNENQSKGVQFPAAEMPRIKLKILPLYHSNTKLGCVQTNAIRVYTDRANSRGDGCTVAICNNHRTL